MMDNYVAVIRFNMACEASVYFASNAKAGTKQNNADARAAIKKQFPGKNIKVTKVIRMPEPGPDPRIDVEIERD